MHVDEEISKKVPECEVCSGDLTSQMLNEINELSDEYS